MHYGLTRHSEHHAAAHHDGDSILRRWMSKVVGQDSPGGLSLRNLDSTVGSAMDTGRGVGEALVVGGLLGAAKSQLKDGLDPMGVPIDGVAALVMGVGSVVSHNMGKEYAVDMRNGAIAAAAVFSSRKVESMLSAKRASTAKVAGDFGDEVGDDVGADDPIVAAARAL